MSNNIIVTYVPQKFSGNKNENVNGITYGVPTYSEAYYYAFIQNEKYTANGNSYQEALNKLFKVANIDIDVSTISNIVLDKTTLIINRSNLYSGMILDYIDGKTVSIPNYRYSYIMSFPYYDACNIDTDFNTCISDLLQNKGNKDVVKSFADISNLHYSNLYPNSISLYATIIKKSYDITDWWTETKHGTYSFTKNGLYSITSSTYRSDLSELLKDTTYDYRFCIKEDGEVHYSNQSTFTTPDILSLDSIVIDGGKTYSVNPTVSVTFNYSGHNITPDYYRLASTDISTAEWQPYTTDTVIYTHNHDKDVTYSTITLNAQLSSDKNKTYSDVRSSHIDYYPPTV